MIGAAGVIDPVLSCRGQQIRSGTAIIGLSVTFCDFSNLARAVCPGTLLIESWEGTEGAVQDASVHGLAGM